MSKAAALALSLTLALGLSSCGKFGGSYLDTKHAQRPEPVPEDKDADWRAYGQTPEFTTQVSWASIGHKDRFGPPDYVYAWVWRKFSKDQETPRGKAYLSEYTRFALDCAKGTMASIAIERRDKDDDKVSRADLPGYQWEFDHVDKQTYMQDFFDQVCKIAHDKANAPADGKDAAGG